MKPNYPAKIITHHSASPASFTVEDVDQWHRVRWPGFTSRVFKNKSGQFYHVGYHFVIEKDGTVTQTRDLSEEGAHCIGQNTSSIGVCFMGNFDTSYPSQKQVSAWQRWYDVYGGGLPVYPHRLYANKSCHGKLLPDNYFAQLVSHEYLLDRIEQLRMLINRLRAALGGRRMFTK